MQGHTHALSGAAAWLAVTSTSGAALHLTEQTTAVTVGGSVVCAGAALLPDWDQHDATIAHSLRPLTSTAARGIEHISGGHRHATHSLIGIAVFTAIAELAAIPTTTLYGRTVAVGAAVVVALCIAFAAKSLGLTSGLGFRGPLGAIMNSPLGEWVVAVGIAGAITWWLDYRWTWLGPCIALGCFTHVFGDMLTPEGVPWLWPWNPTPPKAARDFVSWCWHPNGYFRLPILGHTTRREKGFRVTREGALGVVLSLYVLYVFAFEFIGAQSGAIPGLHLV